MKAISASSAHVDLTHLIGSSDRPDVITKAKRLGRKLLRARLKRAAIQDILLGVADYEAEKIELAAVKTKAAYSKFISRVLGQKKAHVHKLGSTPLPDVFNTTSRLQVTGFANGNQVTLASCAVDDEVFA